MWWEWHTCLPPYWLVPDSDCHVTCEHGNIQGSTGRQGRLFGRDIGIARPVAQLVPQANLGSYLLHGHILSQGNSYEIMGGAVRVPLVMGPTFPKAYQAD